MDTRFSPFSQDLVDDLGAGTLSRQRNGVQNVHGAARSHAAQLHQFVAHATLPTAQKERCRIDIMGRMGRCIGPTGTTRSSFSSGSRIGGRKEGPLRGSRGKSCGFPVNLLHRHWGFLDDNSGLPRPRGSVTEAPAFRSPRFHLEKPRSLGVPFLFYELN